MSRFSWRVLYPSRPANPSTPSTPATAGSGTLILKTKVAVRNDVQAWVEADGKRAADWKSGTTEVQFTLDAGTHHVSVYSIFQGAKRKIFDTQVDMAANATSTVDVDQ